jgi:hypothetical protein
MESEVRQENTDADVDFVTGWERGATVGIFIWICVFANGGRPLAL